jgi:hypothetical protein
MLKSLSPNLKQKLELIDKYRQRVDRKIDQESVRHLTTVVSVENQQNTQQNTQ